MARTARATLRWLALLVPVAAVTGTACALFLWSLDRATAARFDHPWLLWLLPVAGVAMGWLYHWVGRSAEGGNNLILERIHEPGGGVPRRMAPLVLVASVVTQLFGGSAGREGTAVQMGGSIAASVGRLFRLTEEEWRILLMAGVAAGFGAVFGTPVAGTVFALEVVVVGRMNYRALVPCLVAALLGDWACRAWGIAHTHYHIAFPGGPSALDPLLALKVAVAAVFFGLAATFFTELTHALQALFKKVCPSAPWRPALGGVILIVLVALLGTREYLGLGVWSPHPGDVTISSLVRGEEIHPWSWWWKTLFTAVTLAAGFKGGEVTPLFFIGAALGNALSPVLQAPTDLLAALGFVAIFAAASKTPLACSVMGIELFGAAHAPYIALACCIAFLCSGHSGIYLSQRVASSPDGGRPVPEGVTLREARDLHPTVFRRLFDSIARLFRR